MNKIIIITSLVLLVSGCSKVAQLPDTNVTANHNITAESNGKKVTLYKSPTCGCCSQYTAYLEENGYEVEVVKTDDMGEVKEKYGVARNIESCHTVDFGDYFVEGHIPLEVVDKLLAEQPDIDGIALPGMPAGSPGMPGMKQAPFTIYSITDGAVSVYTEN